MEIIGLSVVILKVMIWRMFKFVVKIVVEDVLKYQDVLILHELNGMVVLVGWNMDQFPKMMLSQSVIQMLFAE